MAGTRSRVAGALAAVVAVVVLAACTDAADPVPAQTQSPTASDDADAVVHLTLADYAGLPIQPLLDEYQRANPDVVIEVTGQPGASSHRPTLPEDLASTAPLADVVLLGDDYLGTVIGNAERFADLGGHGFDGERDGALAWAWQRGADANGGLRAAPLTIAPAALCFRQDLLAEAGIAADRDELAALLAADGGGWDVYFDVGRRYHEATGRAWFDQPETLWRAMVHQLPTGYSAPGRTVDLATDPELRARWDLLTAAIADGLSAHEAQWDWHGGRAFVDGTFATFPCADWTLGMVEANVTAGGGDGSTGWDVADVFPGGGWSWGGAHVALAADSQHAVDAAALATWLTDPAQQAGFHTAGLGLPSDEAALDAYAQDAAAHPFFNDAPVGPILAARAAAVPPHVAGPADLRLALEAFGPALHALDQGATDPATAWADALAAAAEVQTSG